MIIVFSQLTFFFFDKKVTQITFILLFIAHHIIQHN